MVSMHSTQFNLNSYINISFLFLIFSADSWNTDADQANTHERIIYPDPEVERDVYVEPTRFAMAAGQQTARGGQMGLEEEEFVQMLNSLRNAGPAGSSPGFGGNTAGFAAFANFGNLNAGSGAGGDLPNDPLLAGLFGGQGAQGAAAPPETGLWKFLNSKIHIALLSIFTYVLINTAPFSCNMFLLFLLWEIVEIFMLREHQSNANGLVNVVFMMAGVSPTKINVFIKWIQLVNKVLRDIAIFLFFFVLSHITYLTVVGRALVVVDGTEAKMTSTIRQQPFDSMTDSMLDDEFDDPFDVK